MRLLIDVSGAADHSKRVLHYALWLLRLPSAADNPRVDRDMCCATSLALAQSLLT